jgi:hypothetical protein
MGIAYFINNKPITKKLIRGIGYKAFSRRVPPTVGLLYNTDNCFRCFGFWRLCGTSGRGSNGKETKPGGYDTAYTHHALLLIPI